ncbi:phosphatidylglycerol lysyltransferase domain-containing protein [Tropicibacter naphthalenivorans]|uniref:Phosphatidylglycerol lysyltransferase n=1 Tax=Tropicibacter naphthalenivorans TaxID=441103 RepID=A0A0P1G6H6_9RHOB|nr:phosphatidylglycerol lysyltransferase domain-containing protein [Tropicibacter naphthalenivorans]CUH77291.1 Phosphatidylglycerol lysyltransferase [Tropicibacter naphthalenivorans]SMC59193.1 phosphatidylglycerol lysyltransferase [Tropicibacter naphthalenivorans]
MKAAFEQVPDMARRVLPLAMGAVLVALLYVKARSLDWGLVAEAFYDIPMWRWVGAAVASGLSFWAIAQYDVIAHRHFRTRLPEGHARLSSAAAIAVGQTTGFGPAVGAALRWRLMPVLGHAMVLRITAFVTLCFFVAWGLLAATVAVPVLAGVPWAALLAFPVGAFALAALMLRYPRMSLMGKRIDLPSLPALGHLVALAACDLIFAGLALHLLLPPELAPPLWSLIAAFTLALGAGMIGGTPGGVGPFELALVTLLPGTATAHLAAALIAFRVVYYALPCILGASYAFLARPDRIAPPSEREAPLFGARAEHPIAAQNDSFALTASGAEACLLRSPQSLTLFLGPTRGHLSTLLPALKREARQQNRLPCLYKLTAQDAAEARRAGWHVVPFAVEATLDAQAFTLDGPERRQLRRFLRKAETAGVTCGPITNPDWERMMEIHCAWEDMHGQERGLTMGRFCPLYLRDKPMFGAWLNGELVAFISAVQGTEGLSLDLMRHLPDLPQGVMHALIHAMILDARASNIKEVSLAALPHPTLPKRLADCAGLTRFKSSFAPAWRPLYIGAPNPAALALTALDIRIAILNPAPLERTTMDLWELDALIDDAIAPIVETPELREAS